MKPHPYHFFDAFTFNALLSIIYSSCSFHFNLCDKVVVIVVAML
jgi:hypothetical protein